MSIPVCPPQDLENEFARQIKIIKWSDLVQECWILDVGFNRSDK